MVVSLAELFDVQEWRVEEAIVDRQQPTFLRSEGPVFFISCHSASSRIRFFVTLSGGEGVSKRVTIFGCFRLLILASKNEKNSININDSIIFNTNIKLSTNNKNTQLFFVVGFGHLRSRRRPYG